MKIRTAYLERFLEALGDAGYRIASVAEEEPFGVVLDDLWRGEQVSLRVFIWRLGHERLRPRSLRAVMARETLGLWPHKPDQRTLLLAYSPDRDVFVGWQPEAHPSPAPNSSIRIARRTVNEAVEHGLAFDVRRPSRRLRRRAEVMTAFRPSHARVYLQAVPHLDELRVALEHSPREIGLLEEAVAQALELPPGQHRRAAAESRVLGVIEAGPPQTEREVGTGFAEIEDGRAIPRSRSLRPGARYLFWFQVGGPVEHSIESAQTELPVELLPERAGLVVALFGFGEIHVDPAADTGRLEVRKNGKVVVAEQAFSAPVGRRIARKRLYFPVRAPDRACEARLRCNVYCDGVLIQSRLVTGRVAEEDDDEQVSLLSRLEYTLSHSLHPAQLRTLPAADLSLMMNGDGDRHQFRFFAPGDDEESAFKADSSLDASSVNSLIDYCRDELRQVSWGDSREWSEGFRSRYESPPSRDQFRNDLVRLAIRGSMVYVDLIDALAGGREGRRRLLQKTRRPGRIEIAASPERFVPAAMFYDSPLDTGADLSRFTLCAAFIDALEDQGSPLTECGCFSGECPSWEDELVVCPGGFWGYRHSIGWPVSRGNGDTLGVIAYGESVRTAMAVADDLTGAAAHREGLDLLLGDVDVARDRDQLLALLGHRSHQIFYLYCHGGLTPGGAPYIRVGAPGDLRLTRNQLFRLDLEDASSLVFLNGCRTTAVSPKQRFDLVKAFVEYGGAVGVIGTEITVFEAMAAAFGSTFLRSFVVEGATVGDAVRNARLSVLQDGNPLGLAYVPFALGGTVLEPVVP